MARLTIRLSDEKHERLRQLAERRKISMNKLIDELSTIALVESDAETRFRARAARGSKEEGLRLLASLDRRIAKTPPRRPYPASDAMRASRLDRSRFIIQSIAQRRTLTRQTASRGDNYQTRVSERLNS